ncbi:MAG: glycosyltransferase family 4 protein [Phycisphaeraceae bacterium]|nr:glycosyltransferase family 4 protein [Phycisphaeraceae bacterium]
MPRPSNDPTKPPSVALFSPGWPAGSVPNGIVSYTAAIVPALREVGSEPFVITPRIADGCRDSFAFAVEAALRPLGFRDKVARKIADRFDPGAWDERRTGRGVVDVVRGLADRHGVRIVEMEESFGWVGLVARESGVPAVARLHGPWFLNGATIEREDTPQFRRRVRLEGEAIAAAPGVTAPCRDVLEQTRRKYRLALPHAEVIPYPKTLAPDEHRWSPDVSEPDTILFVGRFDNHKAGDVVIDAFNLVRGQRPGARLTFVGPDRGVTDEKGRRWSIQEFLADRFPGGAEESGVSILGLQPPAAIAPLRRRHAVTVIASRYENFAYTALEAISAGSPTVITNVGGLPEIIEHERNGLVARPGDAADLADRIVRMLTDAALSARLARQAAADCEARYHPRVVAQATVDYYNKVLSGTLAHGDSA